MAFDGEKVSVNVTIEPLVSTEGKKLGSMIMLEDISAEKRMKSTMARYMDPGIAAQLMGSGKEDDILGGKSAVATIMFTDIRGFTPITESLGAQGTVGFLNDYFTLMVEEISKPDGMLDKFIGDAIMACFGLPIPHDDDEDRAARTAINMIKSLWAWNVERKAKGQLPADMGIGLNTDEVVSGNIGSPKRMNYTLIGDGVNLAARLESACKQYGARILISENTFKKLKGTYRIRDIDDVVVIGKSEPVGVYEILDYHDDDDVPEPDGRGEPLQGGAEALPRRRLGQGGPRLRGVPEGQRQRQAVEGLYRALRDAEGRAARRLGRRLADDEEVGAKLPRDHYGLARLWSPRHSTRRRPLSPKRTSRNSVPSSGRGKLSGSRSSSFSELDQSQINSCVQR